VVLDRSPYDWEQALSRRRVAAASSPWALNNRPKPAVTPIELTGGVPDAASHHARFRVAAERGT